jgi:hypothetical protein
VRLCFPVDPLPAHVDPNGVDCGGNPRPFEFSRVIDCGLSFSSLRQRSRLICVCFFLVFGPVFGRGRDVDENGLEPSADAA